MTFLGDLIRKILDWALFLALIGGLGEATYSVCKEAGKAHSQGLVSLRALNRRLVGRGE